MKKQEYTISVTGSSITSVKPDYFTIGISLENISDTMNQSLEQINRDMASLFRLVESVGIKKESVKVVNLDFDLAYEWKKQLRVFVGYSVEQDIEIGMDVTPENELMAKTLVSQATDVLTNTRRCVVSYKLKNKKENLRKVREQAFTDAQEKAEQYASLAKVRLVGVNTISDVAPFDESYESNMLYTCESSYGLSEGTTLPDGKETTLESKVFVVYDIEKSK